MCWLTFQAVRAGPEDLHHPLLPSRVRQQEAGPEVEHYGPVVWDAGGKTPLALYTEPTLILKMQHEDVAILSGATGDMKSY